MCHIAGTTVHGTRELDLVLEGPRRILSRRRITASSLILHIRPTATEVGSVTASNKGCASSIMESDDFDDASRLNAIGQKNIPKDASLSLNEVQLCRRNEMSAEVGGWSRSQG